MNTETTVFQQIKDHQYNLRDVLHVNRVVYHWQDEKSDFGIIRDDAGRELARYYEQAFDEITLYTHLEVKMRENPSMALLATIFESMAGKLLLLNQGLRSEEEREPIYRFLQQYFYEWFEFYGYSSTVLDEWMSSLSAVENSDINFSSLIKTRRVEFLGDYRHLAPKLKQRLSQSIASSTKGIISTADVLEVVNSMSRSSDVINKSTVNKASQKSVIKSKYIHRLDGTKMRRLSERHIARILVEYKEEISAYNNRTFGSNSSKTAEKVVKLSRLVVDGEIDLDSVDWITTRDDAYRAKKLVPFAVAMAEGVSEPLELTIDANKGVVANINGKAAIDAYMANKEYVWDENTPIDSILHDEHAVDQHIERERLTSVSKQARYAYQEAVKEYLEGFKLFSKLRLAAIDVKDLGEVFINKVTRESGVSFSDVTTN